MTRAFESRPALIIAAIAALVALVGAGIGTYSLVSVRSEANSIRADRASVWEDHQQATDFAAKVMTNLMTIRQETIDQDLEKITADIGGDFAEQFNPRRDSYAAVVDLNKIVADGVIASAAFENETTDDNGKKSYLVILAVDQTIRNANTDIGSSGNDEKKDDEKDEDSTPTSTTTPSEEPRRSELDTASDPEAGTPGAAEGKPENHTYRVRVTVTPDDSGALKVTRVDFIP